LIEALRLIAAAVRLRAGEMRAASHLDGRADSSTATVEILLPLAAVAFGLTAIG
jgi:hypothetical protein